MQDIQTKFIKALRVGVVFIVLLILVAVLSFFLFAPDETGVVNKPPSQPTPIPLAETTEAVRPVRIALVGDIMLDRYIRQVGTVRGFGYIFEKIAPLLAESNFVIGNLEGPVTKQSSLSVATNVGDKNNYIFTFPPKALTALYESNIRIVSIGNNHILDFGTEGLRETRTFLDEYDIDYFGDPNDSKRAVLLKEVSGKKIGMVSYNQFVPQDREQLLKSIESLATDADLVIVYAHWGDEYAKEPTKTQISLGQSFINAGADLVIGSHPHVIQSKERYKGKMIYYSLGNLIFDQYFNEEVRCGAIVTVTLPSNGDQYTIEERFVYLEKDGSTTVKDCALAVPTLP